MYPYNFEFIITSTAEDFIRDNTFIPLGIGLHGTGRTILTGTKVPPGASKGVLRILKKR